MSEDAIILAVGLGSLALGAFLGWIGTIVWLLKNSNGVDDEDYFV